MKRRTAALFVATGAPLAMLSKVEAEGLREDYSPESLNPFAEAYRVFVNILTANPIDNKALRRQRTRLIHLFERAFGVKCSEE